MRIVAVTQARTGSTRLPGKVLMKIGDDTLLELHVKRILKSKFVDEVIVATTTAEEDKPLVDLAAGLRVSVFCGSVDDVLDRFYQAIRDKKADYVIRLTSDCPLIDPALIDSVIAFALDQKTDYCSNILKETFPDGQDIEVFTFAALKKAWEEATLNSEREHVTPYIRNHSDFNGGSRFTASNYECEENYGGIRMTVDEKADYELIKNLVDSLGTERTWKEYADHILKNRDLVSTNAHILRNEGYLKSLKKDNEKSV